MMKKLLSLLFVGGLAALLVILGKKGKLKINNEFINKIWVPALKKWRN